MATRCAAAKSVLPRPESSKPKEQNVKRRNCAAKAFPGRKSLPATSRFHSSRLPDVGRRKSLFHRVQARSSSCESKGKSGSDASSDEENINSPSGNCLGVTRRGPSGGQMDPGADVLSESLENGATTPKQEYVKTEDGKEECEVDAIDESVVGRKRTLLWSSGSDSNMTDDDNAAGDSGGARVGRKKKKKRRKMQKESKQNRDSNVLNTDCSEDESNGSEDDKESSVPDRDARITVSTDTASSSEQDDSEKDEPHTASFCSPFSSPASSRLAVTGNSSTSHFRLPRGDIVAPVFVASNTQYPSRGKSSALVTNDNDNGNDEDQNQRARPIDGQTIHGSRDSVQKAPRHHRHHYHQQIISPSSASSFRKRKREVCLHPIEESDASVEMLSGLKRQRLDHRSHRNFSCHRYYSSSSPTGFRCCKRAEVLNGVVNLLLAELHDTPCDCCYVGFLKDTERTAGQPLLPSTPTSGHPRRRHSPLSLARKTTRTNTVNIPLGQEHGHLFRARSLLHRTFVRSEPLC